MRIVCWILLSLSVISCTQVPIKDSWFCGDKSILGATCFTMLSGQKKRLSKTEWDAIKTGWICSDSDAYAANKRAIMSLCEISGSCSYEVQKKIHRFYYEVDRIRKFKKKGVKK